MSGAIRTVGVAGAGGTMGAGIAIVAARGGFSTIAYDVEVAALERARRQTEAFLTRSVERGKLTQNELDQIVRNVVQTTDINDISACDLVIEAVFEDLAIKQALFKVLHEVCPEKTIFASNTSTLSITEIASGCGREDRVVGMHFCLPAQLMKLIELSPGLNTSEQTFEAARAWCAAVGQTPVRTADRPGFILNALLVPFNNDVIRAVEAGVATPADIDKAVKVGLGYKVGPCELLDLIGLDTQLRLCDARFPVTLDPRAAAPPLLRRMVAAGHLGRKAGRGFYTYEGNAMFGG
jgi:3-hydroxybutyryl-CoA dehydrogenase